MVVTQGVCIYNRFTVNIAAEVKNTKHDCCNTNLVMYHTSLYRLMLEESMQLQILLTDTLSVMNQNFTQVLFSTSCLFMPLQKKGRTNEKRENSKHTNATNK